MQFRSHQDAKAFERAFNKDKTKFVMAESPTFFLAYDSVLQCLQSITAEELPLQKVCKQAHMISLVLVATIWKQQRET